MSATQSLFQHLDLREKMYELLYERYFLGFSGGSVAKDPPANAGDIGFYRKKYSLELQNKSCMEIP